MNSIRIQFKPQSNISKSSVNNKKDYRNKFKIADQSTDYRGSISPYESFIKRLFV